MRVARLRQSSRSVASTLWNRRFISVASSDYWRSSARRLSVSVRERHPEIAWKDISGLRVLLAHRYHRVDPEQVWVIAARDVPTLLEALQAEPR